MNIAVATEYSPAYQKIADVTLPVLERYCNKHNYELNIIHIPDGDFHYRKHEWFKEKLKTDVDAIFYIDIDAIITNHNIKVESFLDEEHHFFITEDINGFNGGVVLLRNTHEGRQFNEYVLASRPFFNNEQEVYDNSRKLTTIIKTVPHPSFNSYRYDLYPECNHIRKPEEGMWYEGQFVLHLPAVELSKRSEILKSTKIIE